MQAKNYYVYIATNKLNRVLYTGVTNSLIARQGQHQEKTDKESFTAKYNVSKIVYYEIYSDVRDALNREKQIKAGSRARKLGLIKKLNPGWKDLLADI